MTTECHLAGATEPQTEGGRGIHGHHHHTSASTKPAIARSS